MKLSKLIEHPEGGRYCEVYRSGSKIISAEGKQKCALTHIYFSLDQHEVSHFHCVNSDEVWNLYQGQGLYLYLWDGTAGPVVRAELSANRNEFCHIVPAGIWQAAIPIESRVLVGCSVAPGFEFADFELLSPQSEAAKLLCAHSPDMQKFIKGRS